MDFVSEEIKWINKAPITYVDAGDIQLCLEYRTVEVNQQEIRLTSTEFDILALLLMNPRRVFTYEIISDMVWNEPYTLYSRKTITNHISNLRKKIREKTDTAQLIRSVHGIGYKFDGNVSILKKMP